MSNALMASIAAAPAGAEQEPTAFFLNPGGWVALAILIVFALLIWKKVPGAVGRDADRCETSADDLGRSEIHDRTPYQKDLVKVDCVVDVQRRQDCEDIGLDRGDQQLERADELMKQNEAAKRRSRRRRRSGPEPRNCRRCRAGCGQRTWR